MNVDSTHISRLNWKLLGFLPLVLLVASHGHVAGAGDQWPGFRGPTDQGLVEDADLPLNWSETENVVWKTPVQGKAWSSPVIWDDLIFVTNATEDGTKLSVVCVDKVTGKVIYDKLLHTVDEPQFCHSFNSYASPSPVIEEGRLYVSFGSPYNACLDPATGDVLWQRTDFVCNHFRGAGSSPLIYNNLLFMHFDGSDYQYVVALDKQTGETVWRTDRTVDFDDINPDTGKPDRDGDWRKAFSTPIIAQVDKQDVLISLGSMALYAYEPLTGKELWRVEFIGSHSGSCRPVFKHGLIYAPNGADAEMWVIRPDGSGVLPDSNVVWKQDRAVPRRPSVLVLDDLVIMVDDSGVAACVNAYTGEEYWRKRLGGNFSASPIHCDGRIYFLDEDGKATVVKADREYEVLAINELGDGFMASPAVSGDALFLRTRSHLYRIEDKQDSN